MRPYPALQLERDCTISVPEFPHNDTAALRAAATGGALCTIVAIDGSFSRRLGAQLCVRPDGSVVGSMADGCLEAALIDAAARGGPARILHFGGAGDAMDLRLPCGSRIAICVDPAPDRAMLSRAVARLDERRAARIALPCGAGDRDYIPELRIVAVGTGPELSAFERQAATFGAAMVALRPHGEVGSGLSLGQAPQVPLDPWTAVVVLFHDHEWERAILPWALRGSAFYIGAQGGRAAREERALFLETCGLEPGAMDRMHGPVGLIAQARDPAVLALSVLAEIVAEYERIEKRAGPA
ncbi:XdhC family protein [Croceicoccus sp. YJ47]|uniref:XdhC family protein n=1 Tax=Croceicoccus sp. YJ47 TaxID=2798724 RepID=UPI001923D4A4|nr:XdhC family protein [Croceicoccus sp. YJ47]QQN73322.1 XdhC family protein [Croceicoccus sp. YJ47]